MIAQSATYVKAELDRLDRIGSCIQAVVDLMIPDGPIQFAQRDRIALLLDFLREEYDDAAQRIRVIVN